MTIKKSTAWRALAKHKKEIESKHMRDWFAADNKRYARYSLRVGELLLDYSRNRINDKSIALLCQLAKETNLPKKIHDLFSGVAINTTEKRPALHTALRNKSNQPVLCNGQDIMPEITKVQKKIKKFVAAIHSGRWKGTTGKSIRHIVNVGIGGSHLGPMMTIHALTDYAHPKLTCHFIATVDDANLQEVLKKVDPETTLFIISSKSFTTIETLTNTRSIFSWMQKHLGKRNLDKHFIAVTTVPEKAIQFGIPKENIFQIWDWVGGRYSIWSAIGLPLALMIGNKHFTEFLQGAYEMDEHFRHAKIKENMPIILALLSIWYINFFGATAQAVAPYSHQLRYFISYLQQLDMESNGKGVSKEGVPLNYISSTVIFGEEGCSGQHAYHQLLHQGKHFIPMDFILTKTKSSTSKIHQDILLASGLSQAQALMQGKTYAESMAELLSLNYSKKEAAYLAQHRVLPGNKPSNILFLNKLTPKNLGALIALYEHKIFVQGIIWNINSFDQWGVELGKQLLPTILKCLQGKKSPGQMDCATVALIKHYKKV